MISALRLCNRPLRSTLVGNITAASMSNMRGGNRRGSGRGGFRRPYTNGIPPNGNASAIASTNTSTSNTADPASWSGTATPRSVSPSRDTSHLSDVRFDSLAGKIDQTLLASIPFEYMSLVQAATFEKILSGVDVLAQAKTGTGKTVAFLLPAIQSLLTAPPRASKPCNVSVLILSPTRELALQIEKEAKTLLQKIPGNQLQVQHCIGGTSVSQNDLPMSHSTANLLLLPLDEH
jgi:ATP-dependent RNA helicase MSS116